MHFEDAERYGILFDLPRGEYNAAEVGGIRTRTIRAGDAIEVECYPLTRIGPAAKAEHARRRASRECQLRLNRKNAEKKIRRLIDMNFDGSDWVLTLTWDYGDAEYWAGNREELERRWDALGLPVDEDDARRALNNFLRRCRARMRRQGEDPAQLRHIYVLESTHERREGNMAGYPHFHFHLVLHAPGLGRAGLEELWGRGFVRVDHLSLRSNGPSRLAAYMTKGAKLESLEADGARRRRWGRSKNLREPVETVSDRRVSRRKAMLVAGDVQRRGREIFEALYPGYRCEEPPRVTYSDFVAGAYIFARLRRMDAREPWEREGAGPGARRAKGPEGRRT